MLFTPSAQTEATGKSRFDITPPWTTTRCSTARPRGAESQALGCQLGAPDARASPCSTRCGHALPPRPLPISYGTWSRGATCAPGGHLGARRTSSPAAALRRPTRAVSPGSPRLADEGALAPGAVVFCAPSGTTGYCLSRDCKPTRSSMRRLTGRQAGLQRINSDKARPLRLAARVLRNGNPPARTW